MRLLHLPPRRGHAGLTMVEMAIGTLVLVILGLSLASSTSSMRDLAVLSKVENRLQDQAAKALQWITADVRRAGSVVVDTGAAILSFPHLFEAGQTDPDYVADEHDHEPVPKLAVEGEIDFGEDREILLVLPRDDDGDGAPDFDLVAGQLIWDVGRRISYTRQLGPDGRTTLLRRDDEGTVQAVARDVERVVFDLQSVASPEVPLDTVRVRLYFRSRDDDGQTYRYHTEALIRMRNEG
jgi:hypothetical protein